MPQSIRVSRLGVRWLTLAVLLASTSGLSLAQEGKVQSPEWKFGFDLAARKAGEKQFSKDTKKYGVEAFLDPNRNKLIYVSETGSIAVLPAPGALPAGKAKDPEWINAMELRVRKVGEPDFTEKTKKYSLEVYKDENTGNLIYVCETGSLAVVPGRSAELARGKVPEWKHAMELKGRKAGEKEFETARKHAVEVFRDENTGNLVYVTDVGDISVLAGVAARDDKEKPTWKHAMEVRVRKGGDPDFNDKTPKIGIEVFQDSNTGKLVYLSDAGLISTPATLTIIGKDKAPEWQYGVDIKARKAGDTDWEKARRLGIEVFIDENTGGLLYVADSGALAAVAK